MVAAPVASKEKRHAPLGAKVEQETCDEKKNPLNTTFSVNCRGPRHNDQDAVKTVDRERRATPVGSFFFFFFDLFVLVFLEAQERQSRFSYCKKKSVGGCILTTCLVMYPLPCTTTSVWWEWQCAGDPFQLVSIHMI